MAKRLVIAEKPSMAQDIARVVSAKKHKDYYENDDYVITSAIGHLVRIFNPEEETVKKPAKKKAKPAKGKAKKKEAAPAVKKKKGKFLLENLPVLPPKFALKPDKTGEERVRLIRKLARRPDIDGFVNACDAGREGELIYHYLAEYLGFDKPTTRLWLQSMTPAAIERGLAELREHSSLQSLRDAAIARSEADWLVGINATRALTALNSKDGGFQLTPAGRVQTPTLALLVNLERQRQAHVPRDFWIIKAEFDAGSGTYEAGWIQGDGGTPPDDLASGDKRRNRIWQQDRAETLHKLVTGEATGVASDKSKERRLSPPQLFDLNSLQREANSLHSMPARATLRAAQSLYERYKLLTYPRTESRYLPPDYVEVCEKTLASLARGAASGPAGGPLAMAELARFADPARRGVSKVGAKVFDGAKVTDHFAIIPTGELPNEKLPEPEQRIYNLVVRRFISRFLPDAVVRETVRTTTVAGESFECSGRVVLESGWLAVGKPGRSDRELPALAGDQAEVKLGAVQLDQARTKPASRYDDAKLLGAMQGAYKLVDEEDLADMLQSTGGLGTPATRAGIIEELIRNDYLVRDKRELIPTRKAFSLIEILEAMDIAELTKAQLTGQWEGRLRGIETGDSDSQKFLDEIRQLAMKIAGVAKHFDPDAVEGDYAELEVACPRCGKSRIKESYRKFKCENPACGYFIWKTIASRQLSPPEATRLLAEGRIGPFEDFISKRGIPFAATLVLKDTGQVEFEFPGDEDGDVDFDTLEPVGNCPKCEARVGAAPSSYVCKRAVDGSSECDFRLSNTILGRKLSEDEIIKLLDERKSDLLPGFISKRTKRPFSAYLTVDAKGKLGFEFEARKPKPAKKGAAKKAAKKKAS